MTIRAAGKIGYVLKRYPRFSETFIVNEILAHQAAGRGLEIFALRPVEETHYQDILGKVRAPVTRFPHKLSRSSEFWDLVRRARAELPGAWTVLGDADETDGGNIAQAIMLALACKEKNVVHLHAHFGTVAATVARRAAALAGITYSVTLHAKDIYFDYAEDINIGLKLRDAAETVTVSEYNVKFLKEKFGHLAGRVNKLYNGMDLGRFSWREPRGEMRQVLAVGRLVEKKGFHMLIEAIRILRTAGEDVSCRIIGGGEEYSNLAAQIRSAGLEGHVTLAGPMPQQEVIRAMRNATLLACPCVISHDGNRDGLPTVLLEAMALGLPCVATSVTGIPELVRDGETGLCVPEQDSLVLADAMKRLLDDHGLRCKIARAARDLIEQEFDISKNAARLRALFDSAIERRQSRENVA